MDDEYYLQPPLKQKFYRNMANVMSFFGVGNREEWGYNKINKPQYISTLITLTFAPFCGVSQVIYFYLNYSELTFDVMGIIFSVFPATILANVSIYSSKFKSYKRISRSFLQKIHLYNIYEERKDEFVKNQLIDVEKKTRWSCYYTIFFFTVSWFGWTFFPAINNYKNRELVLNHTARLQTSLYLWMPFDYSYNYTNWMIIHAINFYSVLAGVSGTMMFQSVSYMFVYNVIGHIQVLKNSLKTDFKDGLSDQEVRSKLAKLVKYHIFINKAFRDTELAFGLNVSGNYLQNLFGNSIMLYQLMYGDKGNKMIYVTMTMAYTGGPILMSFVLEEIRIQTHDLPDIVYSISWENMSISNQKSVMLILQRTQILMDFKAAGGMKAGVAPMISILKTTFSYYVMLKSTIT